MPAERRVDLRSDTVTRPGPAMRQAMADADVGDDVLDGDPTTGRLEERIAVLLGMPAALFFPSGVQANQVAIWLHAERGTEVIVEADAHVVHYEMAGIAGLAGAQIRPVATPDGVLTADLVEEAWRPLSPHVPRISLVAVENTHNVAGGKVMPVVTWDAIVATARERAVPVHLDGARLWHAAVAQKAPPARVARGAASVMVSLSKGLGCPVGSCLVGDREFIGRAREARRRFGGAMRQSGILSAAGLYALEHHVERLGDDHAKARLLADRLQGHSRVAPLAPDTNIVMLDLTADGLSADDAVARLADAGVLVVPFGPRRLRAVTHLDVSTDDVVWATDVIGTVLA